MLGPRLHQATKDSSRWCSHDSMNPLSEGFVACAAPGCLGLLTAIARAVFRRRRLFSSKDRGSIIAASAVDGTTSMRSNPCAEYPR